MSINVLYTLIQLKTKTSFQIKTARAVKTSLAEQKLKIHTIHLIIPIEVVTPGVAGITQENTHYIQVLLSEV